MPRYKITIEYNGHPFCGWQHQPGQQSVQNSIEKALFAFTQETSSVFAAGRTDSGVHAIGQIAHFDLSKPQKTETVRDALNYHLKPLPIVILQVKEVDQDFHARFNAIQRHYIYKIVNRRPRLALDYGLAWHIPVKLNIDNMQNAGKDLLGRHDFTTFRASQCQANSPIKTLDGLEITQKKDQIYFLFSARSFLHQQVRSMVGSLVCVGKEKWSVFRLKQALEAKDRTQCGMIAPAEGLYLKQVVYPKYKSSC